jgi:hypothetical protein
MVGDLNVPLRKCPRCGSDITVSSLDYIGSEATQITINRIEARS